MAADGTQFTESIHADLPEGHVVAKKKRSAEEFARMKEGLDPMQEGARKAEFELLYFDESGFSCLPNVQRSWSPLAEPHTADASLGRKRANVIGALNYATQHLDFKVCDHSVCRSDVISFLDGLATASNPELITFVVMDNASIHLNIDPEITDRWLPLCYAVPARLQP